MGLVAVQTSRLVNQRPVNSVLAEGFIHHAAVATPAELKTWPSRLERGGGCRRVMALVAPLVRHRRMNSVKQYATHVRAVRIVARDAVRLGNRIIDVLAHESGAVRLVTFNAESRHRALEQMGRLFRAMRVMAIQTSALNGAVLEFDFRDGVAKRLMAANTEFVPGLQQVAFVVGGVWIMTLHTIPLDGYLVGTDRLLGNDVVVALQADRTR